jgi:Uma2 family endonuclease
MKSVPSRTSISVEEYLRTSYRPDCDFVDGEVIERNLGEWDHSRLQARLLVYLARYEKDGYIAVPEQRVQVKPKRFRVPDICVVLGEPGEKVLTKPPFLCIEILSPDNRLDGVVARMQDYLQMGVPHLWILDPETKQAYTFTAQGLREIDHRVLATTHPQIELPLAEIFS